MEQENRIKSNGLFKRILKIFGWIIVFLLSTLVVLFVTLYLLMGMLCNGPSTSARETFVATMLETGNMKFVVSWYLTEEEILAITGGNRTALPADAASLLATNTGNTENQQVMGNAETGDNFANVVSEIDAIEDVGIITITGRTFEGKLLVVRDPSRVTLATVYPWSSMEMEKNGMTVGEYCEAFHGLAAVNAGEFETPSGINWGGRPIGVVVCNGEIQFNEPTYGDVMIGFNENHILIIKEVGNMTAAQFETYVRENAITDAVSFKDISDGNTNHFTRLIENGVPVDLNGKGVGANPRTAIGQCADGTVLILVTDGRGSSGHLGATGQDLINILSDYGAVNAANLDGGSSSSLYYEGAYQITSSFLPNSDASRRLPTAFIVQ